MISRAIFVSAKLFINEISSLLFFSTGITRRSRLASSSFLSLSMSSLSGQASRNPNRIFFFAIFFTFSIISLSAVNSVSKTGRAPALKASVKKSMENTFTGL